MTGTDRIAMRPLAARLRLKADIAEIAAAVSTETGIPLASILGPRRAAPIARARQRVMFEAHARGLSTPEIGYALGRDHTTVLYGVRAEAARRGVTA